MSSSIAAPSRPSGRSPRSPWSQPWPLLLTAAALLFAPGVPLQAKVPALFACLLLCSIVAARRRAPGANVPDSQQDAPAAPATPEERWASNRAALYQVGDTMAAEATRSGERMTVLVFEQADLPELHAIFGTAAARAVVAEFSGKLKELAGARGVSVRTNATSWAVLLPGHDQAGAVAAVKRTLGASLAVEAAVGDEEILLVPRLAMHTPGQRTATMRSIYRELCEKIQRAHAHEQMREDYLRRERERHSHPARLQDR